MVVVAAMVVRATKERGRLRGKRIVVVALVGSTLIVVVSTAVVLEGLVVAVMVVIKASLMSLLFTYCLNVWDLKFTGTVFFHLFV